MTFLRFFASLIFVCFIGGVTLTLIGCRNSKISFAEKGALAFGLGWGLLTCEMFYFSLFKIPWNPFLLLLPWLLFLPFSFWRRQKMTETAPSPQRTPFTSSERVLLFFLFFLFLCVTIDALTLPMTHIDFWDAWSTWGHKAKAFALWRTIDFSFLTDPSRPHIQKDHPLLLPLAESWIYLNLGKVDEVTVRLLFPLFYLSFLVLFWGMSRREKGEKKGDLLLVTLLATIPIFMEHAVRGYADLPLTFYYTFSTLYLYFWCREGKKEDLWVAVLFSVFAAWTRSEGQVLWILNALLFGTFRFFTTPQTIGKKISEGLPLLLPLLIFLPWRFLLLRLEASSEWLPQLKVSIFLTQASRLPLILKIIFWRLLDPSRWNLLWGGLLFFGALCWRRLFSFPTVLLMSALFLHGTLYLFVYVIHMDPPWVVTDDQYSRLFLHVAPLALFLLGALWEGTSSREVPP